jgi:SAM-dependent methyltransferase
VLQLLILFRVDIRKRTDDRRVLEQIIFPSVGDNADYRRILFVGCDWYTRSYSKFFAKRKKEYWTIDVDSSKSRFGSKLHIVDTCENIAKHFQPNQLDVIFFNGVIGFGLTGKEEIERSFQVMREVLRPGGLLVFGWNDVPEYRPFPIEQIEALKLFKPTAVESLGSRYLTNTKIRHTYNFYAK